MPAAAVIPAPIAYIKVVAVKKLVYSNRLEMLTDVAETRLTSVGAMVSYPSRRSSVAVEVFILLFHESLFLQRLMYMQCMCGMCSRSVEP